MKTLYESLLDDFDALASKITYDEEGIKKFVCKIYKIASPKHLNIYMPRSIDPEGSLPIVSYGGNVSVKDKNISSLTSGIFKWQHIGGNFDCSGCKNLTSLEGGPLYCDKDFICNNCGKKFTKLEVKKVCVGVKGFRHMGHAGVRGEIIN